MSRITATTKTGAPTKGQSLARWRELRDNLPIIRHFRPIPYKSTGSSYGACGIRIDGSPEFIDAVLSRIKDVIALENDETRLELARRKVESVTIAGKRKDFTKRDTDAEVCYIRVHERGQEARIMNHAFGLLECE